MDKGDEAARLSRAADREIETARAAIARALELHRRLRDALGLPAEAAAPAPACWTAVQEGACATRH